MPVLKTISPNVSPSAPKPVPFIVVPSSRTSTAGRVTWFNSGQLSVEHGGRATQEGGHHPAGQFQVGERRVAALGRARRDHRRGGRRRVVQREVGRDSRPPRDKVGRD